MTTNPGLPHLTNGDVSVLLAALEVFRATGDRRRSDAGYDELVAKLAVYGEHAIATDRETVWCEAHGGLPNPHFETDGCVDPCFTDQATRARMNREAREAGAAA